MSTKIIFCWIHISVRENRSAGGKKNGQLYRQSYLWEVKFITSGLMGCEKLASLSTRRPFLLLLRGPGGSGEPWLHCLLSAQLEWADPDSAGVWEAHGFAPTLVFRPVCKSWCPSPCPWLMLHRGAQQWWQDITQHPNWLLPLCVPSHNPRKLFSVYIFWPQSAGGGKGVVSQLC